jgi:hypothetical protein
MRRFCDFEVGDTFRFRGFTFCMTTPDDACPTNVGRKEGRDAVLDWMNLRGAMPTFRPLQWLCEF